MLRGVREFNGASDINTKSKRVPYFFVLSCVWSVVDEYTTKPNTAYCY